MEFVRICDVMVSSPRTVRADLPIWRAWKIMRECDCRHLPVLDHGKVVGIVSDRDLKLVSSNLRSETLEVSEAMSQSLFYVGPSESLLKVLHEMVSHKYGAALVVDREKKLMGIFTATDALAYLYRMMMQRPEAGANLRSFKTTRAGEVI